MGPAGPEGHLLSALQLQTAPGFWGLALELKTGGMEGGWELGVPGRGWFCLVLARRDEYKA